MANSKKRIMLKKNKKYVYFTGDRHLQRSANNVLDIADNEATVLNLDIIFCEDVDCAKIFDTNKKMMVLFMLV